ncbi:MAG: hypothetical protein JO233_01375 [Candidatus Eremiobacteraeota bacterium]|nr:hypothetical protein [Candidatus Eremiobacteraeota bacterium]
MIVFLAAVCIAAVVVQDVVPGKAWYHAGWYALVLAALNALLLWRLQKMFARHDAHALPMTPIVAGATLVTLIGLSAGLLGPDTQIYTGAPGATIPINEPSGNLRFPFNPDAKQEVVIFEGRRGTRITLVPSRRRYVGAFVMWSAPRPVASVTAEDAAGHRLTITQPTNASFLSPVLLFSQTARIGGRTLPVDSFSLPAVQRIVKTVLFSPATLSQIQNKPVSQPALLVAIEDERGRLLHGAIRLLPSGERVNTGGVTIGAVVSDYPEIVIAAAPDFPIVFLGAAFLIAGLIWYATIRSPSRS